MVNDCDRGMGAILRKTGVWGQYGWLQKVNFLLKAIVLERENERMPRLRV